MPDDQHGTSLRIPNTHSIAKATEWRLGTLPSSMVETSVAE